MKYTTEEALIEIKRRSGIIRRRYEMRMSVIFSMITACLATGLVAVIGIFGTGSGVSVTPSSYGAFLLPAEDGGYILTAIIAFLAGVFLTVILCNHIQKNSHIGKEEHKIHE